MQPTQYEDQINKVLELLQGKTWDKSDTIYKEALRAAVEWLNYFPRDPRSVPESKRLELTSEIKRAFGLADAELATTIAKKQGVALPERAQVITGVEREEKFEALLPKNGRFFLPYVEWTRKTESPITFHVFSALTVLGAAASRKVYLPFGFSPVYANYAAMLVGRSGRVKKTTAVDIAMILVRSENLLPIFAERLTPEALVTSMKAKGGQHFVYAPELSVLLTRANYNSSMITTLIRLLDCPDFFDASTIVRGDEKIPDVALTLLGASAPELFEAMPREATSGGFLNRIVLVYEDDTPRCFPRQVRGDDALQEKIRKVVRRVRQYEGQFHWSKDAEEWNDAWYRARWKAVRDNDTELNVTTERLQTHLFRTAMLFHLAEHDNMTLCAQCMQDAANVLDFIGNGAQMLTRKMSHTLLAMEATVILEALIRRNNMSDHSALLKSVAHRMTADVFQRHMKTLIESGQVREERRGAIRWYILKEF